MEEPQQNSISSFVEANLLTQVDKGVSKNVLSKSRRSFSPSLKIRPYGVRSMSGNKCSSQHGNAAAHLLCSSLLRAFLTLVILLEMEE